MNNTKQKSRHFRVRIIILVGEGGFEPPKPKQQIYSLPHLTALELSHNIYFEYKIYRTDSVDFMELVDGLEPPTC